MNDPLLRGIFAECKDKGRFVFEVCEVFGDSLTPEEMEYWSAYNLITSANIYDVDIEGMSFENAVDAVDHEMKKRKNKQWQTKRRSMREKVS